MESGAHLRILASIISPVARKFWKLRAERSAGENPFSVSYQEDLLDRHLEAALVRLGSINEDDSWWQELLTRIEANYVRPEWFEQPYVQSWMSDAQVKSDFKNLARVRLISNSTDSEALSRIRNKYSEITGENAYRATYAIAVVLAVLHVSAHAELTLGESLIIGALRDETVERREVTVQHGQVLRKIEKQVHNLAPSEDQLHTRILEEDLTKIVNRRGIHGVDAANEIQTLINRVRDGDLTCASAQVKAKLFYWAARILASNKNTVATAKEYLESYRTFSFSDVDHCAYVEAWIHATLGETQKAIEIFSSLNTEDSRTSQFILIGRSNGRCSALEWLDNQQPYNHTLLSFIGWQNAAITMAEEGRWVDATHLVDSLPAEVHESHPELLFIKGVLHAGFLLPETMRARILGQPYIDFRADVQEGTVVDVHREQSVLTLQRAQQLFSDAGANERARACEYHLMWLRLTSPREHDAALIELTKGMEDGEYAMFMLHIALNFGVAFDQDLLEKYLRRQEIEGHKKAEVSFARYRLLQHLGSPSDILSHLEQEADSLKEILTPASFASARIQALIGVGRISDAENELEEYVDVFTPYDLERHRIRIASEKGEQLKQLEELYKQSGEYEDLIVLVQYLASTGQWGSLVPHGHDLLAMRRSIKGLQILVHAMQQIGAPDEDILALLDEHQDIVAPRTPEGDDLLVRKSLALFSLGRFAEAQEIVSEIALRTHKANAIMLEINLAMQTGEWEHFAGIVDREFPRRNSFPADLLLLMASSTVDGDQDRAMELIRIAADRESRNGDAQAYAYWLAVQMGRENDATQWLQRAIHLSQQGKGPLESVGRKEFVARIPAFAEQQQEWEKQYMEGGMGLHQFAELLHVPMSRLLIGQALVNESKTDSRHRSVIPVRSGSRSLINLPEIHSLVFDLSSLLIFEHLQVLENVFDALDTICLAPNLMEVLFMEQRQVRHHQPSLVREAKHIQELVDDGTVQLLQVTNPPTALVSEVGVEMASLLYSAQSQQGYVLVASPVYQAGSFNEKKADLGEFGSCILNLIDFLPHMEGYVPPDNFANAQAIFESADHEAERNNDDLGDGPLYVDDLALHYLNSAGILQYINHLGREIFIAPLVKKRISELIKGAEHSDKLAEILDNLRKRIRDGLKTNKISFLPKSKHQEEPEDIPNIFPRLNALQHAIANAGDADALCLDDRAVGKHVQVEGQSGQNVPAIGSYDVLEYLAKRNAITEDEKRSCDFRLRKRGFAFLPLDPDTVFSALKRSIHPSTSAIRETSDLMAIRENLQVIRSTKILQIPEEKPWFLQLVNVSDYVLIKIWNDPSIEVEVAIKMSDWVADVLAPLPIAWQDSAIFASSEEILEMTKLVLAHLTIVGPKLEDESRRKIFAKWVRHKLLRPLGPANAKILDEVSQVLSLQVMQWAKELAEELSDD